MEEFSKRKKEEVEFITIGQNQYSIVFDYVYNQIVIRWYKESNFKDVLFEWKISFDEFERDYSIQLLRQGYTDKQLFTVLRFEEVEIEKREYLTGKILVPFEGMHSYEKVPRSLTSAVVDFKLPLGRKMESEWDLSVQEFMTKNPGSGCECQLECLRAPWFCENRITKFSWYNSALIDRDNPVMEVLDNTFINVKENRIYERDFDAELEHLWKDLQKISKDNVVDVLIRLVSLGYEFEELVEKLQVKKVLESLEKEGWSEGINYLKVTFEYDQLT